MQISKVNICQIVEKFHLASSSFGSGLGFACFHLKNKKQSNIGYQELLFIVFLSKIGWLLEWMCLFNILYA